MRGSFSLLHSLAASAVLILPALGVLTLTASPGRAQSAPVPAVNTADRQAVIDLYNQYYLPGASVDTGWTGNLATGVAGTVSDSFLQATLQRINYFRAMTGLNSDVTLSAAANAKCQQAALMSAAEQNISHTPLPTWKFYDADAAAACAASNLRLDWQGDEGPAAIDGYIADDEANNTYVGHRRWLLYAGETGMGVGAIPTDGASHPGTNATWVASPIPRPATAPAATSWPPAGYVPAPLVFRRWSYSYDNADLSVAKVAVVKNGVSLPVTVETVEYQLINGAGFFIGDNTLAWEMPSETISTTEDATYTVTVSNVVVNGKATQFSYNVTTVPVAKTTTGGGGTTTDALPTVSITAKKSVAHWGGKAAMLVIARTGDVSKALTVKLAIGGAAESGVDYVPLPTKVVIPAGSASLKVKIAALSGAAEDNGTTATFALKAKAKPRYLISPTAGAATLTVSATP